MNPRVITTRRAAAGFTLIEVLVALALLAAGMAAAMSVLGDSLGRAGDSARERAAVALAQSLLERAGREWPLNSTPRQGATDAGLRWRAVATPQFAGRGDERLPVLPWRVAISVSWDGAWRARSIELVTLRLVARERS